MKKMYKGKVNSPQTQIIEDIGLTTNNIKVLDASVFPDGPNLAVIGSDPQAETIKYESINENVLVGCVRGFQGKANTWKKDSVISRNFTEYDLNVLQENILELDKNKVSKVDGKGLSSNDFTNEEKNKLANIEDGANKYVHPSTHSANIITENSSKRFVSDAEKNRWDNPPKVDLTPYAKTDEVDSKLKNKVSKVDGKGLSSNDFTNEEKNKLANIEDGANKYVHPSTHSANMITETTEKNFISSILKLTLEALNMKDTPSSDFNSVSKLGIYNGSFSSNCPNGSGKYTLFVFPTDSSTQHQQNYMFQIAVKDNTDDTPYFRLRRGSTTWGKWYKYSSNDYTDTDKAKVQEIPPNPKYTDTITTINGKTGTISKEDLESLGIGGLDEKRVREVASEIAYSDYLFTSNNLYEKLNKAFKTNFSSAINNTDDLVNSKTAITEMINNPYSLAEALRSFEFNEKMANSSTAMSVIANSSTAMSAIANSSTAMSAIANSSTAMSAISGSKIAVVALANGALSKRSSGPLPFSDGKKMILLGSLKGNNGPIVDQTVPDRKSELNESYRRTIMTKFGEMGITLNIAPITFTLLDDYNSGNLIYIPIN